MANLLLSVMRATAEFERQLIREGQREGIELAKKTGRVQGQAENAERGSAAASKR